MNSHADYVQALAAAEAALRGTPEWNFSPAWRRHTCASGLNGADLPARVGGGGATASEMVTLFAHCGRLALDLRDVPGAGYSRLLLHARTRHFDPVLTAVATGAAYVAVAITEDGAGSDMHGLAATAEPLPGGDYELCGEKRYVARLAYATHAVVFAHVRRPGSERTLTAFLVPLNSPGLEIMTLEHTGLRGTSFGGLTLKHVHVPRAMRVGGEGEGFQLFVRHFTYWRTAMAAAAIGCGRGALDQAIEWLRERQAFGGPIGRFTHLQQELAGHVARLHMAWLLVQSSAARQDARQPAFADACMAKAEGIEAALAAVDFAQRVHGARGQTTLVDLEQRRRDLGALRIAGGAPDVLRSQVARAVLGNPLYEAALGRNLAAGDDDAQLGSRRFW